MGNIVNTLVAGFASALVREGRAPGTRVKYVEYVERFLATVDDPLTVTRLDVEDYLDALTARGLAAGTIRLHIASLRRFYDHLEDREKVDRNPLARVKPPKRSRKPIQYLTADEDEVMYRACITPQERILHALLRYAGLRIGEAVAIQQQDVDLSRGELRVMVSKSDSGLRTVPIHPRLRVELEAWLDRLAREGRRRPDLPLLVTKRGTAMKPQFGWRIIKRVAQRGAVRPLPEPHKSAVTPHTLRRTFATDLLNREMRIETVSKLLGHADTRVTQASYAELLPETVRAEAIRAWGA